MDCVNQILDFYNSKASTKEIENRDKKSLWLSKLLIRIMNNFAQEKLDDLELRDCLLVLVNLFSNVPNPYSYCNTGIKPQDLSFEEKIRYKEMLLSEFRNN